MAEHGLCALWYQVLMRVSAREMKRANIETDGPSITIILFSLM